MGKAKKSKKGSSNPSKKSKGRRREVPLGGVKQSDISIPGVTNPFEVRVNKRKHETLGRRGRHEQGVPGISRSRAIEKRQGTLLKEYKVRNKSNSLLDKRIGERRKGMPEEEKIIKRSAAEKARQFKKKSIFNLQDSEDLLTHKGQPLGDIDRYDDPRDASDSEDERLDADFVSDANFGGFMKIKPPDPNDIELDSSGQPKSHKQIIQELILASKQKKYEKAKEADENYELVCKLDDEFKDPDIRNLLLLGGKKSTSDSKPKDAPSISGEKEEYDKIVRELQFEAKAGRASDRLKTELEVSTEEKEKLEQLEKDRLKRMHMVETDGGARKHRSADDLDDGYFVEESKQSKTNKGHEEEDEEDSDGEEEEEEESEEESDNFSDIESEEDEKISFSKSTENEQDTEKEASDGEEVTESKFEEIPFVLGIPIKYREFEKLLKTYGAHHKYTKGSGFTTVLDCILQRMIAYNKAADRSRLPQLFNYMMRYVLESVEKPKKVSKVVDQVAQTVVPHMHSLLLLNATECVQALQDGEMFDDFYPILGTRVPLYKLLYFDISSTLFCCTDFNHHVLSPIKVALLQIISSHKSTDICSLMKIFYAIKIMIKLTNESKRYSPEVLNFLVSILNCYADLTIETAQNTVPNIKPARQLLFIKPEENCDSIQVDENIWDYVSDNDSVVECTSSLRASILYQTLCMAEEVIEMYQRLPSSKEIFHPMKVALNQLKSRTNLPEMVKKRINEIFTAVCNIKQAKETLVVQTSDKPKILRLYEPLVEEDFDGMRKKKVPKGKQETARLAHKVKQEMKNAVREIRKDTAFIANQQLREQLEKDAARKRKVKDILGSLANQEGDYQKSKKAKK